LVKKAIELATDLHSGQLRKSGEPYISHPLAVLEILKKYGFSEEVQTAGVLHDIGEDTNISNGKIKNLFTENIAFTIYALSKNKKYKVSLEDKKTNSKFRISLYLRRFISSTSYNPIVLYVKIADQIHNLSTMKAFTNEKKMRKIFEAEKYFMPVYETFLNKNLSEQKNYEDLLISLKNTIKFLKETM
jgi:guanosine-3',5'-bis(diphosphate) 3'-pyrophosphohydrolase